MITSNTCRHMGIAALLAVALLGLTGCRGKSEKAGETKKTDTVASQTPEGVPPAPSIDDMAGKLNIDRE